MRTDRPQEVYLDNNATTQPLPQVCEAMLRALGTDFGNPSSAHAAGERARAHVRSAREAVAALLGAPPETVVFTSSGTEANNMVLAAVCGERGTPARLVTTTVEHSSILAHCAFLEAHGVDVIYLPVDRTGRLCLETAKAAITPATSLVSVQWVNSETGVIQPIAALGALCRARGVLFHTDAAQAVGKIAMHVAQLPVDFLSCTAHKFHGPQGIGALYARTPRRLAPLLYGGSQEHGLRAGTENVPGIVGMGKAAEIRLANLATIPQQIQALRDRFEQLVLDLVPGTTVNGHPSARVCNTSNLLFPAMDGEALVAQLDRVGIRCSQSSACTNRMPEPSAVLRAMGLTEDEAYASVRFGLSAFTTMPEIEGAAQQIHRLYHRLRAVMAR